MSANDNQQVFIKFSTRLASKVHRIKQMLKPVMKLMNKKASRCCPAPTSPACCPASEVEQNSTNEVLERRLSEEILARATQSSAAMQVWLEGRLCMVPISQGPPAIPVHFVNWATLNPDSDIYIVDNIHTMGQTAEEQTPLVKYD
ncbi:uncharacterized protein [Anabrus simplex]|uniref:uncharacterized protein n=1 Tax=Anabrus simplex TaxID=316456 RepID=UPI0034DD79BB